MLQRSTCLDTRAAPSSGTFGRHLTPRKGGRGNVYTSIPQLTSSCRRRRETIAPRHRPGVLEHLEPPPCSNSPGFSKLILFGKGDDAVGGGAVQEMVGADRLGMVEARGRDQFGQGLHRLAVELATRSALSGTTRARWRSGSCVARRSGICRYGTAAPGCSRSRT